jgi:hypothetical protein
VNDSGIRPEHIVGARCKYLCGRVRDGRCHNAVCRSKAAKMQRHGVRWRLPEGGVGSRRWRGLGLYRAHNGALFACTCMYMYVDVVVSMGMNCLMVHRPCALQVLASRVYSSKVRSRRYIHVCLEITCIHVYLGSCCIVQVLIERTRWQAEIIPDEQLSVHQEGSHASQTADQHYEAAQLRETVSPPTSQQSRY